jgi:hypothetical protein
MDFFVILALILAGWAFVVLARKVLEAPGPGPDVPTRPAEGPPSARTADDEIDYEELERAEEEVRDLDINARPEDGFEGDDWGPGVPPQPPKPPLYG